ncbi:MAG: pyridoxal-dependent decarboxylase [Planctomycetota bacterium]
MSILPPRVPEPSCDEVDLDPKDWDAFRALAHRALDQMIDGQQFVRDQPAWRPIPKSVEAALRTERPMKGQGAEAAYEDFLEWVWPYPTGNRHPRFWGWAGGAGTPLTLVAEMLSGGLNAMTGHFNDASSRVDRQVVDWMKDAFGFPAEVSGTLTSGGSVANLVGLTCARDQMAGYDVAEHGIGAEPGLLTVYASRETHSSVMKAVRMLGMGREALRWIAVDEQFRIDLRDLRDRLAADRAAGMRPVAIVGNAGTINTGAVDDLNALADHARSERLWLHVDGAFGAMAALSPELKDAVSGMERADSLAFDFHKWMNIPYEAGCVLIRDRAAHVHSFATDANYLQILTRGTGAWSEVAHERGLQLSRAFKALKVWLLIKEQGFETLGRIVTQNSRQARYFADRVDRSRKLRRVAPVGLNVVAFRYDPGNLDGERSDAINLELLMRIQESGLAIPSSTKLHGRFTIRICICNHRSRLEDFDVFTDALEETGDRIATELEQEKS